MNGRKSRAIRRIARTACDPSLTMMHARRWGPKDDPATPITVYWPMQSFRRTVKNLKRGYVTGVQYRG